MPCCVGLYFVLYTEQKTFLNHKLLVQIFSHKEAAGAELAPFCISVPLFLPLTGIQFYLTTKVPERPDIPTSHANFHSIYQYQSDLEYSTRVKKPPGRHFPASMSTNIESYLIYWWENRKPLERNFWKIFSWEPVSCLDHRKEMVRWLLW